MAKTPPKIPGMDGAVILNKQGPPPGTQHETNFQASIIGFDVMQDEEGKVHSYVVIILDTIERHRYLFTFTEKVRQDLLQQLMEITLIGEKVEADA